MTRVHFRWFVALLCLVASTSCASGTAAGADPGAEVAVTPDVPTDPAVADDPGAPDPGPAIDVNAPGHPHPYWPGVTWDGIWADMTGVTATYHVKFSLDQAEADVPASLKEGQVKPDVGGNAAWTRLLFGRLVAGIPQDAMALYFNHGTPWKITVLGSETYLPLYLEPQGQWFPTPLVIPMDLAPMGTPHHIDTQVTVTSSGGEPQNLQVALDVQAISYAVQCPLPLEPTLDCAELRVTLSGEYVGGAEPLVSQVILHPRQGIVRWANAPGMSEAVLTVPWE
jgi:hypothetical protein